MYLCTYHKIFSRIFFYSVFKNILCELTPKCIRLWRGGGSGGGGTSALEGLLGKNEGDDEAIEPQRLCEDEDKNHSYEELLLLTDRSDSSVSYYANSHTSSQTTQTATHAGR